MSLLYHKFLTFSRHFTILPQLSDDLIVILLSQKKKSPAKVWGLPTAIFFARLTKASFRKADAQMCTRIRAGALEYTKFNGNVSVSIARSASGFDSVSGSSKRKKRAQKCPLFLFGGTDGS